MEFGRENRKGAEVDDSAAVIHLLKEWNLSDGFVTSIVHEGFITLDHLRALTPEFLNKFGSSIADRAVFKLHWTKWVTASNGKKAPSGCSKGSILSHSYVTPQLNVIEIDNDDGTRRTLGQPSNSSNTFVVSNYPKLIGITNNLNYSQAAKMRTQVSKLNSVQSKARSTKKTDQPRLPRNQSLKCSGGTPSTSNYHELSDLVRIDRVTLLKSLVQADEISFSLTKPSSELYLTQLSRDLSFNLTNMYSSIGMSRKLVREWLRNVVKN